MRKAIARGVVLGAALLLIVDAIAVRLGVATSAIPKLAGASPWVTSRAAGVTALVALTLAVAFGLLVSTGAADKVIPRARSVELHRWLSGATLAMTAAHAVALLGDRFVSFDLLDLLLPFASSYRSLAVALGVLAAYTALLVHASFTWRKRIGVRAWRLIHHASFFAYGAALWHGVLAGSDAGSLAPLYLTSGAGVGALVMLRIARARWPGSSTKCATTQSSGAASAASPAPRAADDPPSSRGSQA